MTLNLVVPTGKVLFNFYDQRKDSKTFDKKFKVIMSKDPYFRLTVPPKIWFGFKGVSNELNIICNISNMIHDKNEIIRKKPDEIKAEWSEY